MALTVHDNGKDNKINISNLLLQKGHGQIIIAGDNNTIDITDTQYNFGVNITVGHECSISIGRNVNCGNLFVYQHHGAHLRVGETVGFNGLVRLQMHEPGSLSIGHGCLIADQVEISISDMHSIIDANTRARINPAKPIILEDRIWVGQRAVILKGAKIGAGSVVGACSVVSGEIPANCVVAGNPGRIVRRDTTWDFNLL